jgi:hypothetical protein
MTVVAHVHQRVIFPRFGGSSIDADSFRKVWDDCRISIIEVSEGSRILNICHWGGLLN